MSFTYNCNSKINKTAVRVRRNIPHLSATVHKIAGPLDGFLIQPIIRLPAESPRRSPLKTKVADGRHIAVLKVKFDPGMSAWRDLLQMLESARYRGRVGFQAL